MKRKFGQMLSGIIAISIIISCMPIFMVNATGAIPVKPANNKDYATYITGATVIRGNSAWSSDDKLFWAYYGNEQGGNQGEVLASLNGVNMDSTRPYVVKTKIDLTTPATRDGRVGFVVAGNDIQNFTVLWYWFGTQQFSMGTFQNGTHVGWVGGVVSHSQLLGNLTDMAILRDGNKLTVWAGTTVIYNEETIPSYTGSALGFESASWGTGALIYKNFSIYYTDSDIYPTMPLNNLDYGKKITGATVIRGNAGWAGAPDNFIWAFNGVEKGGNQGAVLARFDGVPDMGTVKPYVVKTTIDLLNPGTRDGRVGFIVAGNDAQNFTVLWYWFGQQKFSLGVFVDGVHASWLGDWPSYPQLLGASTDIAILHDGNRFEIWAGQTLLYDSVSVQLPAYTGSVMGIECESWGTGAAIFRNNRIYYTDSITPPVKLATNIDYADRITAVTNLTGYGEWNLTEKLYSTYPGGESTYNNTVLGSLDGPNMDATKSYVIKTTLNVAATRDGRIGFIVAGNNLQNFTVLWYLFESQSFVLAVFENGVHTAWLEGVNYNLPRDTDTELVILRNGTEFTAWAGGTLIYDTGSVQLPAYTGSLIGFESSGWYDGLVAYKNFEIFYNNIDELALATPVVEGLISQIPTITTENFISQKHTTIIPARIAVSNFLTAFQGVSPSITTSNIANYSILSAAEDAITLFTFGSSYKISTSQRISNIQLDLQYNGPTALAFKSSLAMVSTNVSIKHSSGSGVELADTDKVTTGTFVDITFGTDVDRYTIVIFGDVDATGDVSLTDLASMKSHILNNVLLTGNFLKAGDLNDNGKITISDLLDIKKSILGISVIEQNKLVP